MLLNVYIWTKIPRKKLFGTIRVLAYGLVVSAGIGALTVRNAVADAEEQSLQFGRQLSDLGDLLQNGKEFRLNGQKVYFAAATSDDSVKTVLDRFEGNCNKSPAFDPIEWKSLANLKGKELTPGKDINRLGVVRKEDPHYGDGMVLCFTADHGPKDFFTALQSFEKSGDLHDIGDVRYVHVARAKDGKTQVHTMWTEGSFNVRTLMGTPGQDAVGSDFATLPRPINSVRRFTAEAVGTPYSARVYESTSSPAEVLADYNSKMEKGNWLLIKSPYANLGDGKDGRWYSRVETGEQAAVSVSRSDGHTMVVVGAMGLLPKPPTSLTRAY
jgi:hypothetical protein